MSKILKINDSNITYNFDFERSEIYTSSHFMTNILMILIILVVLLFVYDFFKDSLRNFSGFKDVMSGNSPIGAAKLSGYTRGNIIREMMKYGGLALIFIFSYFGFNTTPIKFEQLPNHIKLQYTQQTGKTTFP